MILFDHFLENVCTSIYLVRDAFNEREGRRRIFTKTETSARLEKFCGKLAKVKGEVAKYRGNEARTVERIERIRATIVLFIVNYDIYTVRFMKFCNRRGSCFIH